MRSRLRCVPTWKVDEATHNLNSSLTDLAGNIMGNSSVVRNPTLTDDADASPFNAEETRSIKLRYEEISSKISTQSGSTADVSLKSTFHPDLLALLDNKGTLKTLKNFEMFLGDGMRVNSLKTLETFWDLFSSNDDLEGAKTLLDFFHLLLRLLHPSIQFTEAEAATQKNTAQQLVNSVLEQGKADTDEANVKSDSKACFFMLKQWVSVFGPCTSKILETYLTETCFPGVENPSFFPFRQPKIEVESYLLPNGSSELIPLSLYCDALQGVWKRLYSSSVDGTSFNRMAHHIMGYEGPICFLIKPRGYSNSLFGAFTSGRWKELNRFYGSSDTFLFTLKPEFKIIRSRDRSNGNYQWLNTKSYGLPHGLALGGSLDAFRLFITESFESCVASDGCLTFEAGSLLPDVDMSSEKNEKDFATARENNNFEIDFIEVFACGGEQFIEKGLQSLAKDREIREENIQRARKVDKAQFFNNAFDQEFLLSGTFAHRTEASGASGQS